MTDTTKEVTNWSDLRPGDVVVSNTLDALMVQSPPRTPRDKFTEGKKFDEGKLRFDLIPVRPLERVAEVYTIGATKYEDENWRKGIRWSRIFGAMMRHAWAWKRGETHDPKDGQHHLASVVWTALTLMEYEETCPELDDRADVR